MHGAIVYRRMADVHDGVAHATHARIQNARAGIPSIGMQQRAIVCHQRAVSTALPLNSEMAAEFVLEVLHGGAMNGPQVRQVGDVVDDLLRVLVQLTQIVDIPTHPLRVIPLGVHGHVVVGFTAFRIVPDIDATHLLHHRPRAQSRGLGDGAVVVGNVVALAIGAEAPGVVRTANGIAFDLAVQHGIRSGVLGQVRAHVRTIGVQQDDLAAFLAAVECEVLPEEAHCQRRAGDLGSICHHEPTAREGKFTQTVVFSRGHMPPSVAGSRQPQAPTGPRQRGFIGCYHYRNPAPPKQWENSL